MDLTIKEIEMLADALDSYESSCIKSDMMSSLLGNLLNNEREESKLKNILDEQFSAVETKNRMLKDSIVLIKYKLLKMKDSVSVNNLIKSTEPEKQP